MSLPSRRELLRIGAVSVLSALAPSAVAAPNAQRRRCVYLFLQGGASHHDLWDPKPDAPPEVRGPFQTIATALPGLRFGELLPHSARVAGRLAVVRSMTHRFTNHIAGTYVMQTGSTVQPDADREAKADDCPGPGAVLNYLEAAGAPLPVSVSLPNWLSIPGPSNRMPGQFGGVLGAGCDPFLIAGDPARPDFRPLALTLPGDLPADRARARLGLARQLDAAARALDYRGGAAHDQHSGAALRLVTDPRFRDALDLDREPDRSRDRYGRTKFGQSCLLARRLVEAGVRFVSVNEFNQTWDTHGGLRDRYRKIVPPMDQAFAALVEDLAARGLLDDTLVINAGEFGRTPTVNKDGGRDHWPNAYSAVLAGGGVRGGAVHGASDRRGAEVADLPVSPADLLATLWHCLGVDPQTELRDRQGRPFTLCTGRPVSGLLAS
jgi:uncharacterized protein (DUF1501 family)